MVDYSKYIGTLRGKYVKQLTITLVFPSTKADCTCITSTNKLSIINSPHKYCTNCGNIGYIETAVTQDTTGILVDYLADSGVPGMQLQQTDSGDIQHQRYVAHIAISSLPTSVVTNSLYFIKFVKIESQEYRILGIDVSKQLGQVRIVLTKDSV
jgi:hypothetical protein